MFEQLTDHNACKNVSLVYASRDSSLTEMNQTNDREPGNDPLVLLAHYEAALAQLTAQQDISLTIPDPLDEAKVRDQDDNGLENAG